MTPEKAHKLNDDRAYTMAMAAYALMCERRKQILKRPERIKTNIADKLPIISNKRVSMW